MADVAYELERFAPAKQHSVPRVRVSRRQKAEKSARWLQLGKMARTLLAAGVLVFLVCSVLYTQATLTEVTGEITDMETALKNEQAQNFYLTFELENMTSLKNIEERAESQGLQRMDSNQVTYFRVEDTNGIEVRENPLARLFDRARNGLLNIIDYVSPQ